MQILHSELDADGIDYMLRDAVFSGTSFGSFEVDQLISCMTVGEYNGEKVLCIEPKGIAAADQYLINKFFSYSQVVFNKHTLVLEWMAEQIVAWMQENNAYFPKKKELRENWISGLRQDELKKSEIFTKQGNVEDLITTFSVRELTKHIPLKEYEEKLVRPQESEEDITEEEYQEINEKKKTNRLMDTYG